MNMRAAELRLLIGALGVSQREAAEAIGVNVRTMRYWLAANPQPPLIAIYALYYLKNSR